jgi:micrococcal nuclease
MAPVGPTTLAQVIRVVDGDTIKVSIDGTEYTVRYIGMDTPETVKPGTPVQWMGPEASAANKALVEGQQVVLEKDVSEVDRYGRLLRDVWLERPDGWLLVNVELVRLGFASVSTFPPDVAYESVLLDAQREAREADRGLWAATPAPAISPGATGGCDAAYPTVCIPPPPPDLDCADISFRRFEVLAPDPHNFDGDHNGIGCEL